MQGGTAGAVVGFVAAIFSVFNDLSNIGMMMFFYFIFAVFSAFFAGGMVGLANGLTNLAWPVQSRTAIRLISIMGFLLTVVPVTMLLEKSLLFLWLISGFTSAMWVSHHLSRLFEMYRNPK